ncbi:MAG TPA: Rpn family recombination-promoting nuclease/putative transposase [Alphaproteobacteria bacterium]|nr:Rpn family recombination-promoting nuclease/putative transposase [Alphaproteobacteria bacterium]
MSNRYVDPTNDVIFKKIFSDKDRLIDFLNAVLRLEKGKKIETIDFIPQEELPSFKSGRRSIFDIKCTDQLKKTYIVEMQNRPETSFLNRVQCYAAHTFVSQVKKGETHDDLMPVILLSLTGRTLFDKEVDCISYHLNVESKTQKRYLFSLSYVFIELPKFKKKAEDLKSIEDEWLYFFAEWNKTQEPPPTIKDPFVLEAYNAIEQFNLTESEYDAYLRSRLGQEADELMMNKTISESIEKGEKIGIEKGEKIGIEKGEKLNAQKTARKMIKKKMDIETIVDFTGLTHAEIENLIKEEKPE